MAHHKSTEVLFSIHLLPSKSIEGKLSYPSYTLPPCSETHSYISQLLGHLLIHTQHHLVHHYSTQCMLKLLFHINTTQVSSLSSHPENLSPGKFIVPIGSDC